MGRGPRVAQPWAHVMVKRWESFRADAQRGSPIQKATPGAPSAPRLQHQARREPPMGPGPRVAQPWAHVTVGQVPCCVPCTLHCKSVHKDPQTEPGAQRRGRRYAGSQGGGPAAEWTNSHSGLQIAEAPCAKRNHPNIISHSPSRLIIGPESHINRAMHAEAMAEQAVTTRGSLGGCPGPRKEPDGGRPPQHQPQLPKIEQGPTHTQTTQRAHALQPSEQRPPNTTCEGKKG